MTKIINSKQYDLEDRKLEMMYKESDWAQFSGQNPEFLNVGGRKIPYGVFDNMPEKTDDPEKIAPHLEEILKKLWETKNRG